MAYCRRMKWILFLDTIIDWQKMSPTPLTRKIGIALIIASVLPWCALPVLSWLNLSAGGQAALAGGLIIAAEVLMLGGIALVGKEAYRDFKQRVTEWIRRRTTAEKTDN